MNDDAGEIVIDVAILIAVVAVLSTAFPSLKSAIQKWVEGLSQTLANTVTSGVANAGKGAVYGVAQTLGADAQTVNSTFSGNPSDPGYNFFYGPQKFSWSSFTGWVSGLWDETFGNSSKTANGAYGGDAGGFPSGTDVSSYLPSNWSDTAYAPSSLTPIDQPTQDLLNSLQGGA